MTKPSSIIAALCSTAILAACSSLQDTPSLFPNTAAIKTGTVSPDAAVRGTPVNAERPARLYVWSAFKQKDCSPIAANVTITKPPAKGTVTFRNDQETVVQHSLSGKCIGQRIIGTGLFYTATKGQDGPDQFEVTATSPGGAPVTKTFTVLIVEGVGG